MSWMEAFLAASMISSLAAPGFPNRYVVGDGVVEEFGVLSYVGLCVSSVLVGISFTFWSEIFMFPLFTSQKRIRSFNSVDFPQPLFPQIPMTFSLAHVDIAVF